MTSPLQPKVDVKFGASGVSEVQRGLRLVGKEGEATAQRVGGSMRQIAGGVEMIARQGRVTGEAMKSIIAQGAEMAFMFGAAGPIVGAIGIVGLAIFEHITGNLKKAKEEINKTRTELENLARGSLMGAAARQQQLYSGQQFAIRKEGESAASFLIRSRGIEGYGRRAAFLEQEMARLGVPAADVKRMREGAGNLGYGADAAALGREYAELFKAVSPLNDEFQELVKITANLAKVEGERTKNAAALAGETPLPGSTAGGADLLAALDRAAFARSLPGVQYMGSAVGVPKIGGEEGSRAFGIKAADVGDSFKADFVNPLGDSITRSIADGIGGAISAGFDAAFARGGNISSALGAFGGVALRTIGGVFKDIGMQTLVGLEFMAAIKAAIATWNPALGIAASIGLIALGSALQSVGSRAMGSATGGGGGGGGYSSAGSGMTVVDRGIINPVSAAGITPMRSVVNNFTVIGANDPVAQRQIAEMVDLGNNRRLGRM